MMSISASAISEPQDHAFRAAVMPVGRADLAENAARDDIAGVESSDDVEKALVANAKESAAR